jgi:hypothetical protein
LLKKINWKKDWTLDIWVERRILTSGPRINDTISYNHRSWNVKTTQIDTLQPLPSFQVCSSTENKFCFDDQKSYYKMLYSSTVLPCIPPQIYKGILQIRTVIEGIEHQVLFWWQKDLLQFNVVHQPQSSSSDWTILFFSFGCVDIVFCIQVAECECQA